VSIAAGALFVFAGEQRAHLVVIKQAFPQFKPRATTAAIGDARLVIVTQTHRLIVAARIGHGGDATDAETR
jgi:hypothetical protein